MCTSTATTYTGAVVPGAALAGGCDNGGTAGNVIAMAANAYGTTCGVVADTHCIIPNGICTVSGSVALAAGTVGTCAGVPVGWPCSVATT
jgi:hypothetical protein